MTSAVSSEPQSYEALSSVNEHNKFHGRHIVWYRSIKKFTDEYKQKKYPIHVLLNNAAIQSPKGKRGAKTEEGFEVCTLPATGALQ